MTDSKKKNMPVRRLVVKKGRVGKAEAETTTKPEFERKSAPSHGFKSHKTEVRMPPRQPRDLLPEVAKSDQRISEEANREFEAEAQMVRKDPRPVSSLSHVPLSEPLSTDPEKVADYCEREPWRLTDRDTLANSPKFGTIPARYRVMAKKARKQAEKADKAGDKETFEKHVDRAAACEQAAKQSTEIYDNQLRKDFRILAGKMSRSGIGNYAQTMWTRVFLTLKKDGTDHKYEFDKRFFMPEVEEKGGKKLQKEAAYIAAARIKWLCINVNEIPLTGYVAPDPKPDNGSKKGPGPLLN